MRRSVILLLILVFLLLMQSYGMLASHGSLDSGSYSATVANQLWKSSVVGSAVGSPIFVDGYIYVNSYFQGYPPRGSIYCLNAITGTKVWNYTGFPEVRGIPFSPVVVGGKVYFGVNFGYVFCLDAYTGAQIWNFTGEGYSNSPKLADGYAYACFGNNVYALNASTGARIWNQTINGAGYQVVSGGYLYASSSNGIVCLDASTGTKKWQYATSENLGSIVVSGDDAFVSSYNVNSHDGNIVFTGNVYCFDAYTGTKKWNYTTGSYQGNSPIFTPSAAGYMVYVGVGNNVYALDASTGTKMWNYTIEGNAGSPVFLTPYLYVSAGASVYCLDAMTGARIWNYTTEIPRAHIWEWLSTSSPVITDDQVFVGSVGPQYFTYPYHNVYALNASTGERVWNYTIEGNAASLTVADGAVYVGSTFATSRNRDNEGNGAVYALKPIVVTPLSLSTVIAVVVVVVVLAVVFLAYKMKRKSAAITSTSTSPSQH